MLAKRCTRQAAAKSKVQQHPAGTVEQAPYPSLSQVWSAEIGLNLAASARMVTYSWKKMPWQLRAKKAIGQAVEAESQMAREAIRQRGGSNVGALRTDEAEAEQARRVAPHVKRATAGHNRG
ncbi:unnamed protein product [Symbiodinium sp. CCMP2456]|nr:unnamed protein product [Symbiodinium sp. CCMP2456]